jgi:hypothetical protein
MVCGHRHPHAEGRASITGELLPVNRNRFLLRAGINGLSNLELCTYLRAFVSATTDTPTTTTVITVA